MLRVCSHGQQEPRWLAINLLQLFPICSSFHFFKTPKTTISSCVVLSLFIWNWHFEIFFYLLSGVKLSLCSDLNSECSVLWQVDNFLLTDDELYDRKSDDELDCNEIGTVPKYTVLDASFIGQGDAFIVIDCRSSSLSGSF